MSIPMKVNLKFVLLACGSRWDAAALNSGYDREVGDQANVWTGTCGTPLSLLWESPEQIGGVRLVFDSNLNNDKRMPCRYPQSHGRKSVPQSLVKAFRIECLRTDGAWEVAYRGNNHQRLSHVPIDRCTAGVRFIAEETWGADEARLFGFEAVPVAVDKIPSPPQRVHWKMVVAQQDPKDLAPAECEELATPTRPGAPA